MRTRRGLLTARREQEHWWRQRRRGIKSVSLGAMPRTIWWEVTQARGPPINMKRLTAVFVFLLLLFPALAYPQGMSIHNESCPLRNRLLFYADLTEASGVRVDSVAGNNLTDNNTVTGN